MNSSAPAAPCPPGPTAAQRETERTAPAYGPRVGYQRWDRLLFAHWKVPADQVQATLPAGLRVDTWADTAYLGLVPFFMQRVRPRGLPPLPGLSWFLELNLRTYVHDAYGRPGVWFYSLDCNQPLAVEIARRGFHLRYEHAAMQATLNGTECDFISQRRGRTEADRFTWSVPDHGGRLAPPGTLDHFLVERYRLFTTDQAGRLLTAGVRHAPYRLHDPMVRRCSTAIATQAGFALDGAPVSLLAAEAVDVSIHPLHPVDDRFSHP